jgi:hypothetical protein
VARARQTTPTGHGEIVTRPEYSRWAGLARAFALTSGEWDFEVAGMPVREVRAMARREAVERAREFSARIGVPLRPMADQPELMVVTGHQPEFYHPGVWIKDFLLQRLAEDTGAAAIDLVVDSDGFDTLEVHSPCLRPEVRVCRAFLAVGTTDGCYACAPVPDAADIEEFCRAGAEQLRTLPAPALERHFALFCEQLQAAATTAHNLAELVTFARRRYESAAGTDYLELPVTSLAQSRSFAALVAHIALDARAFAATYNGALRDYRDRTGTRSAAQPFPDLVVTDDAVELPLWSIAGRRATVWARTGERPALLVEGEVVCDLSGGPAAAAVSILGLAAPLAPKALALTLYTRLLVADLFIHGVGGGRYDQVTDDVLRRYFGVEPPPFAVASMTMYLPLGAHVVKDEEVEAVSMALNRLQHNPDQMLPEIEFETTGEHDAAVVLAHEKASLVTAIATPGADKKALGARIREVNAELAALLEPFERDLRDELDQLTQLRAASEVLTDRTYPFCFWDPREIADKAR